MRLLLGGAIAAACAVFLALGANTVWATPETPSDASAPQHQLPQIIAPWDGTWDGKLFFDKEAFLATSSTPAEGAEFRIEISGPVVRIFTKDSDGFQEAKPGAFHIATVGANAVIFGTDSQRDVWVESWVFVMTQKDDHTLTVEYSRLVNNVGVPPDYHEKIFGTRGIGEFQRTKQP